jgi:phosphoribosylformimino-5-aminoimidazole carboxamide ribotide isomerase
MNNFKIIPVIDILNSKVVHAYKGNRNNYKPLESDIINTSNPIEVIRQIIRKFHFYEFYIADLDAILKNKPNTLILSELSQISNINIMLDPGIKSTEDIEKYSHFNLKKLILGLETIDSYEIIDDALSILGQNKVILSIDMYKGIIISKIKTLDGQNPLNHLDLFFKIGINELILLDLYRVGQKIGDIPSLYLEIRDHFKGDILIGGGIKSTEDILEYKNLNFSGVLIATALYDGSLDNKKLKNIV